MERNFFKKIRNILLFSFYLQSSFPNTVGVRHSHVVIQQLRMESYRKCNARELLNNIAETRKSTEDLFHKIKNRFYFDDRRRLEQIKFINKQFEEEERSKDEERRRAEMNNLEEERRRHETTTKRWSEQRYLRKKYFLDNDLAAEIALSIEDKTEMQRLENERCRKAEQYRLEQRRSFEIVDRVRCIRTHHKKRRNNYLKLMEQYGIQYIPSQ